MANMVLLICLQPEGAQMLSSVLCHSLICSRSEGSASRCNVLLCYANIG